MSFATLAAVDLGSNSFRLEIGRIESDQIYPLDTWKDTIRFGAGLDASGYLNPDAQTRAIGALSRFGERLRGWSPSAVRAVATNTFRVARNAVDFLPHAEEALGFPVEIVSGREEARLIYLGVSHTLPRSERLRLVVDVGGGSTEFIIGKSFDPQRVESLKLGCVGFSLRYFPGGKITRQGLRDAELAARSQVEEIAGEFADDHWQEAYGSSGTVRALAEILEQNGWSKEGITLAGLDKLRDRLLAAGSTEALLGSKLPALKPERAPVLAGGFAIVFAVLAELGVERMLPAGGAMRLGVLYDLLGRTQHQDTRATTVDNFALRYAVDEAQASRVMALAGEFLAPTTDNLSIEERHQVQWSARLHELGFAISHSDYHKHTAYILENAEMPGFSTRDQRQLALLALAQRGNLRKVRPALDDGNFRAQALAIRLATLFCHARRPIDLPPFKLSCNNKIRFSLPSAWLDQHPLTAFLLQQEGEAWEQIGVEWKLSSLDP